MICVMKASIAISDVDDNAEGIPEFTTGRIMVSAPNFLDQTQLQFKNFRTGSQRLAIVI